MAYRLVQYAGLTALLLRDSKTVEGMETDLLARGRVLL